MLIRMARPGDVRSAEITDPALYLGRREFLRQGATGLAATAAALALPACSRAEEPPGTGAGAAAKPAADADAITPWEDATSYNNFYELGTGKDDPKRNAGLLRVHPWTVEVSGEVERPGSYALDDLLRGLTREERIYRLRCVETWSMVIPWLGVPLAKVIERFGPRPTARFVEFRTLFDPERLPGQRTSLLDWPYREGLRMDEAMHPLALLATGMYGKDLLGQNGAPLRLVVPWKYGFKSIKSIVSIRLVQVQPPTSWNMSAPHEYGFYANVNPDVDHPRWSQRRERRIGDFLRRPTLPFNGYADQVASLYAGMDLRANF